MSNYIKDVLTKNMQEVVSLVEQEFSELKVAEAPIRINLSATFKCTFKGELRLFKYLLYDDKTGGIDERSNGYYCIKTCEKVLLASSYDSFATIFVYKTIEIGQLTFLVLVEEYWPYSFHDGIIMKFANCNNSIYNTCFDFLMELLQLYMTDSDKGFEAHRDLSFDNLMFNEELKLKMIDSGSMRSTNFETTELGIDPANKRFYAPPVYEKQADDFFTGDISKSFGDEIYTIGLLTISLMYLLKKYKENGGCLERCGLEQWLIDKNQLSRDIVYFPRGSKEDLLRTLFFEIFDGNPSNKFYKTINIITSDTITTRTRGFKKYQDIYKYLGGEFYG